MYCEYKWQIYPEFELNNFESGERQKDYRKNGQTSNSTMPTFGLK